MLFTEFDFYKTSLVNPASPLMYGIIELHDHIFFFLNMVLFLVLFLIFTTINFFSYSQNTKLNKYLLNESIKIKYDWLRLNHGTTVEIIWTIIPSLILVLIAIPSFALLYATDELVDPSVTIQVIGHQWYWSYEYNDLVVVQKKVVPFTFPYKYDNINNINSIIFPYKYDNIIFAPVDGQFVKIAHYLRNLKFYSSQVDLFNSLFESTLDIKVPLVSYKGVDSKLMPLFQLLFPSSKSFNFLQELNNLSFPQYPAGLSKSFNFLQELNNLSFPQYPAKEPIFALLDFSKKTIGLESLLEYTKYQLDSTMVQSSALHGSFEFDSYLKSEDDLNVGEQRLYETDFPLVLPKNTHIRFMITADDVIHSWSVPALGIKVDAVPGRINHAHTFIKRSGVFYGQCSELCGVNHAFMPIQILAFEPNMYYNYLRLILISK